MMKQVAKLLIVDKDDKYLLMYRNNHPTFGDDPDLPGGTLEVGETLLEAMLREVAEEVGIVVDTLAVEELYSGADYSKHGTHYGLFSVKLSERPEVVMSWEHAAYEWLGHDSFLEKTKAANDTYMHMVHEMVRRHRK